MLFNFNFLYILQELFLPWNAISVDENKVREDERLRGSIEGQHVSAYFIDVSVLDITGLLAAVRAICMR